MPRCIVAGCSENGRHLFPKDPKIRKLWEQAVKIKKFKAGENSRLCHKHFKDSDYLDCSSSTGLPQVHKYLRKNVIPSIFPWQKTPAAGAIAREKRYLHRLTKRELFLNTADTRNMQENQLEQQNASQISTEEEIPEPQFEIEIFDRDVQNINQPDELKNNSVSTQTPHTFRFTEELLEDPKAIKFYTGLENIQKFRLVLATLLPMANYLQYRGSQVINLSVEDQFLLMLIKLRRNKADFEIGKFFGISASEVGNIFVTWVNFVYELWSKIDIWPERCLVDYYMPLLFKIYHPTTRIIIDGTEVPITRPKNPAAQQSTFSSYKHHNTVKFLVGSTPGGLISFCSEGYAGSTSDRQMTERSTLIQKCDEKDSIMADRGFNVQDLFTHKDISVMIPTFLKGMTQLPGIKLKRDRQLARNRIHIERLIGLTKTYQILKTDVNAFYVPLLSRIFFVCVMLCNFREGIIK